MAVEKNWLAVTATPFTADGTNFGVVTIADTAGFKVKGSAFIVANTLPPIQVQIQRVLSNTQLVVGPIGSTPSISNKTDISAYTVALNALIGFPEQSKNRIKPDDIEQAIYEADPTVAWRVVFVDQYGQFYGNGNPLPIAFDGTISIGTVTITNLPNPVSTNYGTVNSSTIRTAAQIGNATGSANFNVGPTGAQTLRVASNLYDSAANGLTSTLIGSKQALDVNIAGDSFLVEVGVVDESSFTYGTSVQQPVGGVYQDTSPTLSAGQTGAIRLTQNRAFHSNLRTSSGTELDYNFGAASASTIRSAALIGNSSGIADFNAGNSTAQTLRVSANITRNGTELSYNSGASDSNTLRTSSNLKREGNDLDYNYGVTTANTIRTASQVGNTTGAADFNAGATSVQTLRTSSNITRNGNELSYNSGVSDVNTLRIASNLKREGNDLDYNFGVASANTLRTSSLIGNATGAADFNFGVIGAQTIRTASQLGNSTGSIDYNFGTVSAQTIRSAAQIGNSTGAADFNEGSNSAQTLRVSANIARNGTELSYNSGSSDANTIRTASNLKREGNDLDYNYGTVGVNSLRIAAQIGNATGSADFNAGITGTQTQRVSANITRNGTELSYNAGASDANTLRTVSNLKREGNDLDYNYGTVGANSLRIAAQIGNATGAADFNVGTATAQTLRTIGLLYDSNATGVTLGQKQASSSLPVVTQADNVPASQNITAQDSASILTTVANGQVFVTGTPTAGSAATFNFSSFEALEVQVTGTWTGTLVTEVTTDGGSTWIARGVKQAGVSYITNSFTANFAGGLNVTGMVAFRVRSTAAWTGTATVNVVISVNTGSLIVSNPQILRDGTTQSIVNTIKAASTAASASDTSLIVGLSPNSPLPSGTNTVGVVGSPDESLFTYGTTTQQVTGGVYQDTLPTLSSGQQGAIRLTQYRGQHTNLRNSSGVEIDYNFGAASAGTIRSASLIGNATGAADFNVGATSAQTQRVSANITRNGTELSYNSGVSDANTIRTASNLYDSSANGITSTSINSKQRLDVNSATDGTSGSPTPFQTTQVGGTDGTDLRALGTDSSGRLKLAASSYFHPVYSTRVQSVTAVTTVLSTSLAATISPTKAGNTIIVAACCNAGTLTIADSASQTYSTATTIAGNSTQTSKIFYFPNTAAGVTTVTISSTSSTDLNLIVTEYSGILTASPLDQTSTHGQTSSTTWTSNATSATAQASELLIGTCMGTLHNTSAFTAGTGWNSIATVLNTRGGANIELFLSDQNVNTTGTYAFTGTVNQSEDLYAAIATFKFVTPNVIAPINSPVVIKSSAGILRKIVLNTIGTGSASMTLYDNTTNSGTIIGVLSLTTAIGYLDYNLNFSNGLTMVVNSTVPDFTLVYD